jgi:diguanylate cyclase (GGDEF)-like protein
VVQVRQSIRRCIPGRRSTSISEPRNWSRRGRDGSTTPAGEFQGVVATDLSLQHVNDFLRSLKLSANGIAYVVETDGNLVGTSRGPHLRKDAAAATRTAQRRRQRRSTDGRQRTAKSASWCVTAGDGLQPRSSRSSRLPTDSRLKPPTRAFGMPPDSTGSSSSPYRAATSSAVTRNYQRTSCSPCCASLMTIAIGFMVLSVVARDLKALALRRATSAMATSTRPSTSPAATKSAIWRRASGLMQGKLLSDRLTGLANREAFLRRVEDRLAQQQRSSPTPRPFAILFIDLNDFKHINDSFGHDVGDKVLQEIAQRMLAELRSRDLVARYAGDEFVVMLDAVHSRARRRRRRSNLEQCSRTAAIDHRWRASGTRAGASVGLYAGMNQRCPCSPTSRSG